MSHSTFYRLIILFLTFCFFSSPLLAERFIGEVNTVHPNPLLQQPQTLATFKVNAKENQKIQKIHIKWQLTPNVIESSMGMITVPNEIALANEFDIGLIDPSGQYWPLTNPSLYRANAFSFNTNLQLTEINPLRPIHRSQSNNSNIFSQTELSIPTDIQRPGFDRNKVELTGLKHDQDAIPIFDESEKPITIAHQCTSITNYPTAGGKKFPVCSSKDLKSFKQALPTTSTVSSATSSFDLELPVAINTFGNWVLIARDTRPILHDKIALNQIPLSDSVASFTPAGTAISDTVAPSLVKFPRMQFVKASLEFKGRANALPDTSTQTRTFRNELNRDTVSKIISDRATPIINPNIRKLPTFNQPKNSTFSSPLSNQLNQLTEKKAQLGANTIVMSGLRLQRIKIRLNVLKHTQGNRPAINLVLEDPKGNKLPLTTNIADGQKNWSLSRDNGNLPESFINKPIDGVWKLLALEQSTGKDVSKQFQFDFDIEVDGPSTDVFQVIDFTTPKKLKTNKEFTHTFRVTHNRPVKKLWFRGFANNFIGFKHNVSITSPSGQVFRPCRSLQDTSPCVEVGLDGLSRFINLPSQVNARGEWKINWKVIRSSNRLEEESGGSASGQVCEANDVIEDFTNAPSNGNSNSSNTYSLSADNFNLAYLLKQESVSISGFLIGFGETHTKQNLLKHAILDSAEIGVVNKAWFERHQFDKAFWDVFASLESIQANANANKYLNLIQLTDSFVANKNINAISSMKGAFFGHSTLQRMRDGFDFDSYLNNHVSQRQAFDQWGQQEHSKHTWNKTANNINTLTPFNFDPNMKFYMEQTMIEKTTDHLGTSVTVGAGVGTGTAAICSAPSLGVAAPACGVIGLGVGMRVTVLTMVLLTIDRNIEGGLAEATAETIDDIVEATEDIINEQAENDAAAEANSAENNNRSNDVGLPAGYSVCTTNNNDESNCGTTEELEVIELEDEVLDSDCIDDGNGGLNCDTQPETECEDTEDGGFDCDFAETNQPCLDCGGLPPEGWYQTYASDSTNPLIQYWGDLAPYINCGPDGCTSAAPLDLINGTNDHDLGPLINCSGDEGSGACSDDQLVTYCTSFNWSDTFTDPPENPDAPIDSCPDRTQPCPETCNDSSQPCPDNL